MTRRRISPFALVLLALSVTCAACGTSNPTAMSLEEAKRVTTASSGTAFVPPPRTINDITAILDQQKLFDPDAVAKIRARAEAEAPATQDPAMLARFYADRGQAAKELGRARQAIDDLARAVELGDEAGITAPKWRWDLFRVELSGGNPLKAVERGRLAISRLPEGSGRRGRSLSLIASLTIAYLRAGDIDNAEKTLRTALDALEESRRFGLSKAPALTRPESELRALWAWHVKFAQGQVAIARGRPVEAERYSREALAVAPALPRDIGYHEVDLGQSLLATSLAMQGRLTEAELEARVALMSTLAKDGRYSIRTTENLQALALILAEQGRPQESEDLLRAAVDITEKIGAGAGSYRAALARSQLGSALAARRRWKEAVQEYRTLRVALVSDAEAFERYVTGDVNWPLTLLATGDVEGALEQTEVAFDRIRRTFGSDHPRTAEIRAVRAMALAAKGQRAESLREFAGSVPILLKRSLEVDDEATTRPARERRLQLILESYIRLLAELRGTALETEAGINTAAEAFRLAEAAGGRTVQQALDASAARGVTQTPALADLVRREQDARKQRSALEGMLVNVYSLPMEQQDPKVVGRLRAEVAALQRARETLGGQIEREFPAYASLINPAPATVAQARTLLRHGEALIATLVTEEQTYVWAVPARGPVSFAVARVDEKRLTQVVGRVRAALDARAATLGDIPAFDVGAAHELYRRLLEPVSAGWEGAETLLIVAHGPLGQLPFGLLPMKAVAAGLDRPPMFSWYRSVPWLARRHAVTTLPSINALATLRTAPSVGPDRRPFIGFGDPYFSEAQAREADTGPRTTRAIASSAEVDARSVATRFRDVLASPGAEVHTSRLAMLPRLPDTREEIVSMARAVGADLEKDVFFGRAANEQNVNGLDLTRYRVIAFATHGLVPGDLDGLTQPALALTAPEVARIPGDGLLTMEKILRLRLNADWVVLSACNTANGVGKGAEAISGLGRAFFYAGARALLVTHWPVETRAARALTTELFRRQATGPGVSRAKALQATMNWMIDEGGITDPATGKQVFSFAHPIFWAPFALVGDGG